ncbi:hypothetical protein BDV34DRAFT_231754 [Aspergillus parasiticus]|uniref:Uncharacterized protein n=1 Tax=Aspergillus parasiticus TaxID=5067 RepID=A0A5N6D1I3_ASPPA|nr:hypothetical protein BDV34DRAFT_231754 [Aspergillus parasiticus]
MGARGWMAAWMAAWPGDTTSPAAGQTATPATNTTQSARPPPAALHQHQRDHPVLDKYIPPPVGLSVDMLQAQQLQNTARLAPSHMDQHGQLLPESGHSLQILNDQLGLEPRGLAAVDEMPLHIQLSPHPLQQPGESIHRPAHPRILQKAPAHGSLSRIVIQRVPWNDQGLPKQQLLI